MLADLKNKVLTHFTGQTHAAPLAVLRMAFGGVMFISIIRFISRGWVTDLYVTPKFYFPYYGFEWVKPLGETGMYCIFTLMAGTALFILLGLFYRTSAILFFISFTYVELIDKTNYLNHYYFISLVSFLLILVPAHRYFSLDVLRKPSLRTDFVPGWTVNIFKLQLLLVYFFAGVAKLNYDWLFEAMPLRIWLPSKSHMPLIGPLLEEAWVAFAFSWIGAIYDLLIGFLLLKRSTRTIAYFFVVAFHILTWLLFQIGMFPWIMIGLTLVFFSVEFHQSVIRFLQKFAGRAAYGAGEAGIISSSFKTPFVYTFLFFYFSLQVLLPFRYLLYPGDLFWTEQGFRFSWRVMLMEKAGTAFFYVTDPSTGVKSEVASSMYLTPYQEKMMATQPDMILQFAHFLEEEYKKKGIADPIVTAESYVTLNGSGSRPFIDTSVDLSKEQESFLPKKWVLPFHQNLSQK